MHSQVFIKKLSVREKQYWKVSIENEVKEQKERFLGILLGKLIASL